MPAHERTAGRRRRSHHHRVLVFLGSAVRVLREYERGVIFRLGRLIADQG